MQLIPPSSPSASPSHAKSQDLSQHTQADLSQPHVVSPTKQSQEHIEDVEIDLATSAEQMDVDVGVVDDIAIHLSLELEEDVLNYSSLPLKVAAIKIGVKPNELLYLIGPTIQERLTSTTSSCFEKYKLILTSISKSKQKGKQELIKQKAEQLLKDLSASSERSGWTG
jgi:hypothetical protein